MVNQEQIKENIGKQVTLNGYGDLGMERHLRYFINHSENPLTIIKLTKSGMAYLQYENGKYYSIPPKNVELI